jgi:hypothetical protein
MVYLIDYENVKNLTGIQELNKTDTVIIFYTENAKSLTFEDHINIKNAAVEIDYKKVTTGKNALDFQLSSYLGFLIGQGRTEFCIISKDQGFDSVISFWKNEKNISIKRRDCLVKDNSVETKKIDANPTSKTPNPVVNTLDMKNILSQPTLHLTPNEIVEVERIVNQYKTKVSINSNLQKMFKGSQRAGEVYKVLKPFLKDKK